MNTVTIYFPSNEGLAHVRKWAKERAHILNPKTAKILRNNKTRQLALLYEAQKPIQL